MTQMKSNRIKKGLIILACIICGLIIWGIILNNINISIFGGNGKGYSASNPFIAAIYVEGSITSNQTDTFGLSTGYQHDWTMKRIDELMADDKNKGLIIFIDSPGGGVYESDELYLKIKDYKDNTNRPVYAVMGSMATSGGYYIASAADWIVANRNTWTGSIGVTIGTLYDISDLLERYGVKTVTITSGENKAMGSAVDPLTPEQQAIFQGLIDEAYEQFVSIVSEERNIDIEETKTIADGRIYTAKQALELGLVDQIGTMSDAVNEMSEKYDLWNCEIIDIIYEDNSFIGSLMSNVQLPDIRGGDVSSLLKIVENNNKLPISYQCELLNN